MRRPVDAFEDVHEFIERYLLESFAHLRRQAPELKVVIAALINDPEMTADFGQKHDEAVGYVAGVLGRFQESRCDRGVGRRGRDRGSDRAVELRGGVPAPTRVRAVGGRVEGDREVVGLDPQPGLQAEAPLPLLEPRSRKAVAAVLDARQRLDSVIELLGDADAPTASNGRAPRRGRQGASARA